MRITFGGMDTKPFRRLQTSVRVTSSLRCFGAASYDSGIVASISLAQDVGLWTCCFMPLAVAPFILLAIFVLADKLKALSTRRLKPGVCHHCGYDLTGNTSGRCPECGQAIDSLPRGKRFK
jgi:hypothetical protein